MQELHQYPQLGWSQGKKRGRVTIKATANGVTASVTITVGDLKAPSLGNWKKTYDSANDLSPLHGDGVTYTITWGKIQGATGYQVLYSSNDNGTWYKKYYNVKKTTFSDSFSHIDIIIKAKVRAYVSINGVKYYGAWSTEKTKVISYSDKTKVSFKSLAGKGYVYKNAKMQYGIGFNSNGNRAYLGIWNASGTSSSYEDFVFPIKEGTYSYRVKGQRSGKYYTLEATPHKNHVSVRLICENSQHDQFDISQNFTYEKDAYFVTYAE